MRRFLWIALVLSLLAGCGGGGGGGPVTAPSPPPLASPTPLTPAADGLVEYTGLVELFWKASEHGVQFEWEVHRVGGSVVASGSTELETAVADLPDEFRGQWAWRVRAVRESQASDWSPFVLFETRWAKPPKLRGVCWWNPTKDQWNQEAYMPWVRATSNVIQIKWRDWRDNREGAKTHIRKLKADGWREAQIVLPTLWVGEGDRWAIDALFEMVRFIQSVGLFFEFIMIGDEPGMMDAAGIRRADWVYDQLRRRLNAAGLAHVKMYYDWYPWGVKGEGGGDWERAIDRYGWPKEDAHANHAGYACDPDSAVRRINYFAERWLNDHGRPDAPIIITLQVFTGKDGRRLTWPWVEERLKNIFLMPRGPAGEPEGRRLSDAVYRRLTLLMPFAMGGAGDTGMTAVDAPDVIDGFKRLRNLYFTNP